jgi:hypothetical protein
MQHRWNDSSQGKAEARGTEKPVPVPLHPPQIHVDILHDVGHRLYQEVLYFQIVTPFHGTQVNIISFTLIKSMIFPAPIFTKLTNAHQHYAHTSSTYLQPNRTTNVERTDINSLTPVSSVWLSLRRFSRNSQSL